MIQRVFIASVLFLLYAPVPATAEGPIPDSATIYAKVDQARGPLPHSYWEVLAISESNGAAWRETHYVNGDDYRVDYRSADIDVQAGTYKGDAWHQNANGQTVIHEAEPGLATKETYTTTVTRIETPVAGYRVAELNARGWGSVDYIDSAAWQIVRTDTIDGSGTSVETFGPRVKFGATALAKVRHHHDADTGLDRTTEIVTYEADGIGDADVAIPPNRRTLVEFPIGVNTVNLPATFQNDRIYVMVTINGHGYDFLLDSGAGGISVDPGAAAKIGLHVFDKQKNAMNAGSFDTAGGKIATMSVGPLTMHDVYVETAPIVEYADGVKCVGLLGFDFLAELGVRIDYENKVVTVHHWGTFTAPTGPQFAALPIRLDDQTPHVSATINGATAERITVDTGAQASFMLFDYFARRHPEALSGRHAHKGYSSVEFEGVGGLVETKPYQLDEIDFAAMRFVDFVGYVVTSKNAYASDEDGLFGSDFLHFYDVYLDYPNGQIVLGLNATGRKAAHHR